MKLLLALYRLKEPVKIIERNLIYSKSFLKDNNIVFLIKNSENTYLLHHSYSTKEESRKFLFNFTVENGFTCDKWEFDSDNVGMALPYHIQFENPTFTQRKYLRFVTDKLIQMIFMKSNVAKLKTHHHKTFIHKDLRSDIYRKQILKTNPHMIFKKLQGVKEERLDIEKHIKTVINFDVIHCYC